MAFLKPPFALTLHTVKKENKKTSKGVYRNRFEHVTHSLEAPMLLPTAGEKKTTKPPRRFDICPRWPWNRSMMKRICCTETSLNGGSGSSLSEHHKHWMIDVTFKKKKKQNKSSTLGDVKSWKSWFVCKKNPQKLEVSCDCLSLWRRVSVRSVLSRPTTHTLHRKHRRRRPKTREKESAFGVKYCFCVCI